MSRPSVSAAWSWRHAITRSDLPATTRHVLLTLSVFMDEAGQSCYPSVEDLMAATGLSKNAVLKHLAEACEAGWLVRRPHGYRGQKWRRFEYEACWPGRDLVAAGCDGEGGARGEPPCEAEVVHDVGEGGAPGGSKVVHDVDQDKDQSIHHSNTSPSGEREARAPDSDPPGKGQDAEPPGIPDPDLFERFARRWPTFAADSRPRTERAWAGLSHHERVEAERSVEAFLEFLKGQSRKHVPAAFTYLAERRWEALPADRRARPLRTRVGRRSREFFGLAVKLIGEGRPLDALAEADRRREHLSWAPDDMPDPAVLSRYVQVRSDADEGFAWGEWLKGHGLDLRLGDGEGFWMWLPARWPPGWDEARVGKARAAAAERRAASAAKWERLKAEMR